MISLNLNAVTIGLGSRAAVNPVTIVGNKVDGSSVGARKTITFPTGTTTGDLVLAWTAVKGGIAMNVPAGWTALTSTAWGSTVRWMWKIVAGGDTGFAAAVASGVPPYGVNLVTVRGHNPAAPIAGLETGGNVTNTRYSRGAGTDGVPITSPYPGALVLQGLSVGVSGLTLTLPFERVQAALVDGARYGTFQTWVASETRLDEGPVNPRSMVISASSAGSSHLLVVCPAVPA